MISFNIEFNLDTLEEPLLEYIDQIQRTVALDLWGKLIKYTPIDTGRARSGWSIGINGKDDWEPGEIPVPAGWKKGRKAIYPKPSIPSIPKGADYIMVYNNVEYITLVNSGTSKRAGVFFVEKAVNEVKAGISL
jgi:hypothetical protein